jgi:hypothetical protein
MKTIRPSSMLKTALAVDAGVGAAAACAQLALAGPLSELLSLPRPLLVETGLFLVGLAALLAILARSERVPAWLIRTIVVGNVAWSLACVGLWVGNVVQPGALGIGYLVAQAVAVFALAMWEAAGLRRSHPAGSDAMAPAH